MTENSFINNGSLDLNMLLQLQEKPAPFTPGEPLFWDDPHISGQMLATHLDPDTDLASRKPETIDASVGWMMAELELGVGDHLLDLGCGPGLYANRFAQLGLQVMGVDYSRRSVNYARNYAEHLGLDITYRYQNYLDLEDAGLYDAAALIFGDYCALNPDARRKLLTNVCRALKPNGHFVLDVTTPHLEGHRKDKSKWSAAEAGFWRPTPHIVLENGFKYPDQNIYLDQYIIIENDGTLTVYRNWFQDFTPEMIRAELSQGGFDVLSLWGDLTGEPYQEGCEWIGVVARKPQENQTN